MASVVMRAFAEVNSLQYNCRENQVGSIDQEEHEGGAQAGWEYRPMRSMRSGGWQAFRSTTAERISGEYWRCMRSGVMRGGDFGRLSTDNSCGA